MNTRNLAKPAYDEWEKLLALLQRVGYDGKVPSQLFAIALATNSHEIAHAMFKLSENDVDAGQPTLLRALLESSARFVYLAKNPDGNTLKLELADVKEGLKAVGRNQTDGEDSQQRELRANLLSREQALAKQSVKCAPSIYDIVCEVGSSELYRVYRGLSAHVHAQWSALAQRSVKQNERGPYVVAYSQFDATTLDFLWWAVETLLAAIRNDFDKFRFEKIPEPTLHTSRSKFVDDPQ